MSSTPLSANRKSAAATPKSGKTVPRKSNSKTGIGKATPGKSGPSKDKNFEFYKARYVTSDLDLEELFHLINKDLFRGSVKPAELRWSMRMTSSVGVTTYYGKGKGVVIALSKPLLALRPRMDLVETLIHEMIHAYIFITYDKKAEPEEHGPNYIAMQEKINKKTGFNISVNHDFHDEADFLLSPEGKKFRADLKKL